MKRFFRPLVLLLLAWIVALSPLCGLAQEVAAEEEAPITHTAIASVALKVRRSPSKDASAGDSIPRDSFVLEEGKIMTLKQQRILVIGNSHRKNYRKDISYQY